MVEIGKRQDLTPVSLVGAGRNAANFTVSTASVGMMVLGGRFGGGARTSFAAPEVQMLSREFAGQPLVTNPLDIDFGKMRSSLDEFNSLRGTGNSTGNLAGITGSSVEDIVRNIPKDSTVRKLTPSPKGSQVGLEYKWVDGNGITNRLRMHDPDPSAGVGSNSAEGWTARWQVGKGYYDPIEDSVRHPNVHKTVSPFYDPAAANNTHSQFRRPTIG